MKTTNTQVALDQINWGSTGEGLLSGFLGSMNVRDSSQNYDYENNADDVALYTSIASIGLTDDPVLARTDDGIVILKGTRRLNAVKFMAEKDKTLFETRFPTGKVPVKLVEDASDEDLMLIVADHHTVKKLSPLEQFYTVSRFHSFGWDVEKIVKQTGLKKGTVTSYGRIAELGDMPSNDVNELYSMCIRALRGRSGYEEDANAQMPASQIILGVLSACKQAQKAIADEPDADEQEAYDSASSSLKATKDQSIEELLELARNGEGVETPLKTRKASEIRERFELAEGDERDALGWVLQMEGFDWTKN